MATHQKKHNKNTSGSNELVFRSEENGEEYAVINASKGDARFEITFCANSVVAIAKARGAIISGPKKKRLDRGDMVLIQADNSTSKGDKYFIIHKYSPDDVKRLRKAGELAQIKEVQAETRTTVAFENDVIVSSKAQIEVDEDFIGDV